MEQISINDLYEVNKALESDGYKLIENKNGVAKYQKGKEIREIQLSDYLDLEVKTLKPNYDNCILNIVASLKKYYGKKACYKTNPELDQILAEKKYKHIAVAMIDGMGSYMLRKNLTEESFLQTHKIADISSVYPSTTACAIPASASGKEPIETAWVGWENYFKEIDKNVVMFRNTDYFTDEKLDFNTFKQLPYKKFYANFDTAKEEMGPCYYPNGCENFQELCDKYLEFTKNNETSFAYLYWDEPDSTQHIKGSYSVEAKQSLQKINDSLEALANNLSEDSLLIVSADHGHIDCNPIYLYNFTGIVSCLQREPSNEGRATFFKVKTFSRDKFVRRFKRYFGDYFKLIPRYDFIMRGYLGKNVLKKNARINSFIGDYVAVATKQYYFNYRPNCLTKSDDPIVFKSHHAGITANEMMVPFIVIKK